MSRYTSTTEHDRAQMLKTIGVDSVDDLFADVPPALQMRDPIDLPLGKPELEVCQEFERLADRNTSSRDEVSFLGGGMYDHYVPAFISSLMQRAEFLTPYTPYQPEASQGTLQFMFEYQTAISELTALPVSNATLYDGASAVAAAAYLARLTHGGDEIVVSAGVHPHSREALTTTSGPLGTEVTEVGLRAGSTDMGALKDAVTGATGAVIVQQPNYFGGVEDLEAIRSALPGFAGSLICACDPIALGVLKPPGQCGFDIAVGEGQPLGNHLNFGGPTFGFMAAKQQYVRKMPGRIAGQTVDADGNRAWCLTLQTREQHIRREKATSNITTAQTLNALGAVSYLAWLGREGLVELAELLVRRTGYLRARLVDIEGVALLHRAPVIREFAITVDAPVAAVVQHCKAAGVNPGVIMDREYPEITNGLLIAVTERNSRDQLDRLVETLADAVR